MRRGEGLPRRERGWGGMGMRMEMEKMRLEMRIGW